MAKNKTLKITEMDRYLFGQGTHYEIYKLMGAHPTKQKGKDGVYFAVWAPRAQEVAVVGDFNGWDPNENIMKCDNDMGIYQLFIPGVKSGDLYKFCITSPSGELLYKADPYANYAEKRPGNASRVYDITNFKWNDSVWMKNRQNYDVNKNAMSIYEVHPGSWRKHPQNEHDEDGFYNYRELAHSLAEYVKDMGTPARFHQVEEDFKAGRVSAKNLSNKQKAIFLDRDGTINKYVGFLRNIDDFELIDGVSEAIKKINASGYLAIVVTNQPVIARGEVTFQELEEIHNKMETLLGKEGAYLDAIYYCPHHPHKGYEGERPELKIECDCRKPKPGMLLKAAEDFNIDMSQSWMIGDGENDVKAGINAGCKTVLLSNGKENYGQTVTVKSLFEFVDSGMK